MKLSLQSSSNTTYLGVPDSQTHLGRQRRKSSIAQLYCSANSINHNVGQSSHPDSNSKKNVSNPNTLAVNSSTTHRRSVIGRQDRIEVRAGSFQAQRLSDVGVAVGQQITAKMGLKLPASQERIVEQTRWLYLRYLFDKLRQKSLPLRDLNLTKSLQARRAAALESSVTNVLYGRSYTPGEITSNGISPQLTPRINRLRRGHAFLGGLLTSSNGDTRSRLSTVHDTLTSSVDFEETFSSKGLFPKTSRSNPITALPTKKYMMDMTINNHILSVIKKFVTDLREAQPDVTLYDDTIYELIGIDKFTSLEDLLQVQKTICQETIRSEISWSRIVTLFSIFGAMSLDCVRLGSPEHVGPLLDGFVGFIERDLSLWISQQGGWESFLYQYGNGISYCALLVRVMVISVPIIVWMIISIFKKE